MLKKLHCATYCSFTFTGMKQKLLTGLPSCLAGDHFGMRLSKATMLRSNVGENGFTIDILLKVPSRSIIKRTNARPERASFFK